MDDGRGRDTGRVAIAVGAVAAGSAACLATYFVVGGPFGTLNDLGNATAGVLSGVLAWRLRDRLPAGLRTYALAGAAVGAGLTVVGSALVVSRTTGYLFAGLVSSVGFAGIGGWLIALARGRDAMAWPGRLRAAAFAAGGLMALGLLVAPGIPLGLDDPATAPGWVWLGFVSWLGIFVVYPAWAVAFGLDRLRDSEGRAVAAPS
jgi:hypothetical protein